MLIYHNPRCSKSREALTLLQAQAGGHGRRLEVIEYLQTPPTLDELRRLHALLGVPVREMLRDGEAAYQTLDLGRDGLDDDTLLSAIARHPELLQRPIVVDGERALIARPPQRLQDWV